VDDIKSFQENVGILFFFPLLKEIQDVVSAFSIFDPKKTPKLDSSDYGKDSLSILLHQYGLPGVALSLDVKNKH